MLTTECAVVPLSIGAVWISIHDEVDIVGNIIYKSIYKCVANPSAIYIFQKPTAGRSLSGQRSTCGVYAFKEL
jgi:hypothetical protein